MGLVMVSILSGNRKKLKLVTNRIPFLDHFSLLSEIAIYQLEKFHPPPAVGLLQSPPVMTKLWEFLFYPPESWKWKNSLGWKDGVQKLKFKARMKEILNLFVFLDFLNQCWPYFYWIYLKDIVVLPSKSFQDSKVSRYFFSEKSGTFLQNIICWLWETRECESQSWEFEDIFSVDHHARHQGWFTDSLQLIHHIPGRCNHVKMWSSFNHHLVIMWKVYNKYYMSASFKSWNKVVMFSTLSRLWCSRTVILSTPQ